MQFCYHRIVKGRYRLVVGYCHFTKCDRNRKEILFTRTYGIQYMFTIIRFIGCFYSFHLRFTAFTFVRKMHRGIDCKMQRVSASLSNCIGSIQSNNSLDYYTAGRIERKQTEKWRHFILRVFVDIPQLIQPLKCHFKVPRWPRYSNWPGIKGYDSKSSFNGQKCFTLKRMLWWKKIWNVKHFVINGKAFDIRPLHKTALRPNKTCKISNVRRQKFQQPKNSN